MSLLAGPDSVFLGMEWYVVPVIGALAFTSMMLAAVLRIANSSDG
jgi:hypothetical protein